MAAARMDETLSWQEITDNVCERSQKDTQGFRSWFKDKEQLGYMFDAILYSRLYEIRQSIMNNDRDHFICIAGKEGLGKSTFAGQIAANIDPNFKIVRFCYKMTDFLNQLEKSEKGDTFILDEGNLFLFSRESMSDDNKTMIKLFALMRQKNLCVIICVPNFWTLDSYVRDHRVDTLINVTERGKYYCYTGLAIKIISKEGSKFKTFNNIRVPEGTFWPGYFNKKFPTINDVSWDSYTKLKHDNFSEFLGELKEKAEETEYQSGGSKFISVTDAVKIFPLDRRSIIGAIKRNELVGKQICGRFYVERESLTNTSQFVLERGA